MDNITDISLYNFTDSITNAVTELPNGTFLNRTFLNETSSNVTSRSETGGVDLPYGYYSYTRATLWIVVVPIIMAWGLLGNCLTMLVLFRQMTRKVTSTSMYLLALAFSDCLILLCGPLRNFIRFKWQSDVRDFTDTGCRIQVYFTYASVHMSSWLLVAVTMERVLSVVVPHKVKLGCTPKLAGVVIISTLVCVLGLNVWLPIMYGWDAEEDRTFKCGLTSKQYYNFRDNIWNWVDFFVAFAIPFVFLLIGNIVIIAHLCQSAKRKKQMVTSHVASSKTTSISVLLVLLCFVFFTTMTPVSVFLIYEPYRIEEIMSIPSLLEAWDAYQYLSFEHTVVNIVGYTNASFNFLMYVLSGSKFRNDLKQIMCCCFTKISTKGLTSSSKTKQTTDGKSSSSTAWKRFKTSVDVAIHYGREDTAAKYSVNDSKTNEQAHVDENNQSVNCITGVQNAAFSNSVDNIGEARGCCLDARQHGTVMSAVADHDAEEEEGSSEMEMQPTMRNGLHDDDVTLEGVDDKAFE